MRDQKLLLFNEKVETNKLKYEKIDNQINNIIRSMESLKENKPSKDHTYLLRLFQSFHKTEVNKWPLFDLTPITKYKF